ncbi:hypothetical protein EE612_057030 [Oryza sativa]|nr:hypothetical protein EE612_057030 [Oryza sativa]
MLQSALPKSVRIKNQVLLSCLRPSELKKILKKIENIINDGHKILQLLNLPGHSNINKRQTVSDDSRIAVTTASPPFVVIGRDEDRDKILVLLHETENDGQHEPSRALSHSIIGIHGIPGSGKSTLAQYVCAHEKRGRQEKEAGHFDLIMWVHVSRNFNVDKIFSKMLEEATGNSCPQFNSLNTLEQKLEQALSRKRFLLVLDDVWYNKDDSQEELQKILFPLKVGALGSKILLTSRTRDALLALGAAKCIPISELDDTVFLELFMHYALDSAGIDERDRMIFRAIGSDIAKKLKRSPLAARTVGGQLHMRPTIDFWQDARNQNLLNETMGALWWSYQHLDQQVRRCFAYCSIFPRRHRLERHELINLWVAEGFITTTEVGLEMEAVGRKYFEELVSASFLQLGEKQAERFGASEYFTVHDLLHDLAEKVARNDCFKVENGWTGDLPGDVRHLYIESYNKTMITEKVLKMGNLRTLIIYSGNTEIPTEEKIFERMFMRLRKLRVLSVKIITGSHVFSFPESIGQLRHLRHLCFRTTLIRQVLPNTIAKLRYMHVLDFGVCGDLVFPSGEDMSNLINLQHIIATADLNCPNIGMLTSLQTLPLFPVKKEPGYELQQLRHLNKLRGKLHIHGLENVGSKEEALEAKLDGKERLKELVLVWDDESCSPEVEAEVLEGLCPPLELERLEITDYHGSSYPDWMIGGHKGPKYLRELELSGCSRLGPAPELFEFFIHLRSLWLWKSSWNFLPDNLEQLMSLHELKMYFCLNIQSLPKLPRSLEEFGLGACDDEFMRSCKTIGHPNWHKIQHIPRVTIALESTHSPHGSSSSSSIPVLYLSG